MDLKSTLIILKSTLQMWKKHEQGVNILGFYVNRIMLSKGENVPETRAVLSAGSFLLLLVLFAGVCFWFSSF